MTYAVPSQLHNRCRGSKYSTLSTVGAPRRRDSGVGFFAPARRSYGDEEDAGQFKGAGSFPEVLVQSCVFGLEVLRKPALDMTGKFLVTEIGILFIVIHDVAEFVE